MSAVWSALVTTDVARGFDPRHVEVVMDEVFERWCEAQPEAARADLRALHARLRAAVPEAELRADGVMLGYAPFRYRYASGREGVAFLFGVAVRSGGLALYVNATDGEAYAAEAAAHTLGKAKVGKSCIRFKRTSDLEAGALDALLARAVALGGAGAVAE